MAKYKSNQFYLGLEYTSAYIIGSRIISNNFKNKKYGCLPKMIVDGISFFILVSQWKTLSKEIKKMFAQDKLPKE